jgi:hypothetical protein
MSISRILIAATAGAALLAAAAVSADERTEADIPDLSGLWEPPGFDLAPPDKGGPGPVLNMSKNIQQPVGDYKNSVLQPWAAAQVKKWGDEITAGRVPDHVHTLCMPMQVPGVMTLHNAYEFLQLKDKVVILIANQAQARYVYLNVPHSKTATPSWYGESVGHYENGDTLVVDTIGLTEKSFVDNYRTPHTSQLHVVERYRLTDGGNMLEVAFQVEDPGAFTMRWSAIQRFRRVHRAPMSELPCVESNTRYFNYETYPVPSADKADF